MLKNKPLLSREGKAKLHVLIDKKLRVSDNDELRFKIFSYILGEEHDEVNIVFYNQLSVSSSKKDGFKSVTVTDNTNIHTIEADDIGKNDSIVIVTKKPTIKLLSIDSKYLNVLTDTVSMHDKECMSAKVIAESMLYSPKTYSSYSEYVNRVVIDDIDCLLKINPNLDLRNTIKGIRAIYALANNNEETPFRNKKRYSKDNSLLGYRFVELLDTIGTGEVNKVNLPAPALEELTNEVIGYIDNTGGYKNYFAYIVDMMLSLHRFLHMVNQNNIRVMNIRDYEPNMLPYFHYLTGKTRSSFYNKQHEMASHICKLLHILQKYKRLPNFMLLEIDIPDDSGMSIKGNGYKFINVAAEPTYYLFSPILLFGVADDE